MPQSPTERGTEGLTDYLSAWLAIGEMSRQGNSWSGRERNNIFLNTTDGRFADVSASSGADFLDDARSTAVTDWDGDGDLDLWIANRTGPRVRFLSNRSATPTNHLTLRLVGTGVNRDAIGARVSVSLADGKPPLVQTLRAGEGFLAQSSKWIHFGLGDAGSVERVEVRWPGGGTESFSDLTPGGRYRLVEGSGVAQSLPTRSPAPSLEASPIETSIESGASHVRLTARPILPPVDYRALDGTTRRLATGRAVLLNLWASWCAPCVTELRDLEERREELGRAGLEIVALSVDEDPERARALLASITPGYEVGFASTTSIDVLDILQKALLEERRRLALPTSFLIDASGRLAVLYKGPLRIDDLIDDLSILPLDPYQTRAATVPLAGLWATFPAPFPHAKLAGEFASFGHADVAGVYRRLAGRGSIAASGDDPIADDMARAFDLLGQGERREAERIFGGLVQRLAEQSLAQPGSAAPRVRLGVALIGLDRPAQALQAFEQALEIQPDNIEALTNATVLNWRGGRGERARELLERLSTLDPAGATEVRRWMAVDRQ